MKTPFRAAVAALLMLSAAVQVHAQVAVTEVAPWSSGNSAVGADWFELTNTGSTAVTLTGWKFDDNSNSFAASVELLGVTTLAAGESMIFVEGAGNVPAFITNWFGSSAPAGLQIGSYSGSGVGLGTGGDAVNIYTAAGVLVTRVDFGASPSAAPFATFDNAAGQSGITLTALSISGVHGAFAAASGNDASGIEIGSPGRVAAVPEPASIALLLSGLAAVGAAARRRAA